MLLRNGRTHDIHSLQFLCLTDVFALAENPVSHGSADVSTLDSTEGHFPCPEATATDPSHDAVSASHIMDMGGAVQFHAHICSRLILHIKNAAIWRG
jgi:hypothetical protein